MIFKCGLIDIVYSFRKFLAEILQIEIEIKPNIQIIANDFNGFINFCFRNVCNLFFVIFCFSASLNRSAHMAQSNQCQVLLISF